MRTRSRGAMGCGLHRQSSGGQRLTYQNPCLRLMGYTFLATVTFNSTQDNRFLDSFSLKWMDGVDFVCGCVSVCNDKRNHAHERHHAPHSSDGECRVNQNVILAMVRNQFDGSKDCKLVESCPVDSENGILVKKNAGYCIFFILCTNISIT